MTEPLVLILLGPPGSGKGTQAKRLSAQLNIPHISTGDLFRHHMHEKTSIGKKVHSYINQGYLVPDDIVLEMVYERVEKTDCKNGYILDGAPRTIDQAKALQTYFTTHDIQPCVIDIEVPEKEIIKRLKDRQRLEKRTDDAEEIIRNRLEVYHRQTKPLTDHYKALNLLYIIEGKQDIAGVNQSIMLLLKEHGMVSKT